MIRKRPVLMAQVNYQYGNNVFIPYSVGSLQAYALTIPEIRENFQFQRPLFLRHTPTEVVKNIEQAPTVVGLSSYLWNWEYNKTLAKILREAFPECLIIFGGTQVPDASGEFFKEHPYVDILVHNEGELKFTEILLESLSSQPDYSRIPGLSLRTEGNQTYKTISAERIMDLSKLPSPYLSGIFDFMIDMPFILNASQETIRGCPYSCTFCDWGGATFSKLFSIDEERLLEEFHWFGRHKVEYLFNCDANYGIKPRDLRLTEKMLEIRAKYDDYPRKFRMCTAKNSNDKIFSIAKMLHDADMAKGATLSFQSMDQQTLKVIKRSNIKLETFSTLMNRYRKNGIPTYTELIMGMPGETYESTKNGVNDLIDAQEDSINIFGYVCSVLPNSEMRNPDYAREHKIQWVQTPVLLAHSTPEPESVQEYNDIVVSTASMPNAEWRRTYLFYWAVQSLHSMGLLRYVAIFCRRRMGLRYSDFYEKLIDYFSGKTEKTIIGEQIGLIRNAVADVIKNGGRLDIVLPKFGNIYWPLEEASFLVFAAEKVKFYDEVRLLLSELVRESGEKIAEALLDDLATYQSAVIKDPYLTQEMSFKLGYDFHEYFSIGRNSLSEPRYSQVRLIVTPDRYFSGDLEIYAREVAWYGRKGGKFHCTDIKVEQDDSK